MHAVKHVFDLFVPKTILDDLISLEGLEPRDVTPR